MEKKKIITLGGLPGSGKSTVREILARRLGYRSFYTGGYMRSLAEQRGMQFDDFNALIATDKSIDLQIDAEQTRIGKAESEYIVDAHIGYHFIPDSFKVFLTVPAEVAADRIFKDKDEETRIKVGDIMNSLEEAKERIAKRLKNHKDRYMRHYGIDPYDESQFDLVVDTSKILPDEVATKIINAYQKWLEA